MEQFDLDRVRTRSRSFYRCDEAAGLIASGIAKRLIAGMAGLSIVASSSLAVAQDWKTDQYSIEFAAGSAAAVFRKLTAVIHFDGTNLAASSCNLRIYVSSISSGNALIDEHLKSEEWFDAARYPVINYVANKVTKTPGGYQATGNLAMHGVTKQVVIPFSFQPKDTGGVFMSSFNVNRDDFGVGQPGGEVPDIVKVNVSVEVTPK